MKHDTSESDKYTGMDVPSDATRGQGEEEGSDGDIEEAAWEYLQGVKRERASRDDGGSGSYAASWTTVIVGAGLFVAEILSRWGVW